MKTTRQRKTNYIWDRPNTDAYWFSRAVPKPLWNAEGRKVVQFSLGTSDRREAEASARAHASELDARWGLLAPARMVPTDHDLESAAVAIAYDLEQERANAGRRTLRGKGPHMWAAHRRFVAMDLADQAQRAATGDIEAVRELADEAIEALGFDLRPDSEGYDKFCEYLNRAKLAQLRVADRRNAGDIEAETDSPLVVGVRSRDASTAAAGETLMELFDAYSAASLARNKKRRDTLTQDRKVVAAFSEFVGEQRAPRTIGRNDARDYRNAIEKLPANFRKMKRYKGMSIREATVLAATEGDTIISPMTVNKYVSTVSPFFQWLVREAYVDSNPFTGFHLDISRQERRENSHPPFTTDQLNTILSSTLFTGFLRHGKEWIAGNVHAHDWRRWIPLLCLFTGARIGEIAQLKVGDIQQVQGVWLAYLREEKETGQQTKSRKTRVVPLHSKLIALGFLKFHAAQVERAKSGDNPQLFPELTTNDRDQMGHGPSRWWRKFLTNIGVKDGADRLGAHSFRSTISDEFRKSDVREHDFGPLILGHSNPSVTEGYGILSEGTPKRLSEIMELAKFEGVRFDSLI